MRKNFTNYRELGRIIVKFICQFVVEINMSNTSTCDYNDIPSYCEVFDAVKNLGVSVSVSEAHGKLCAFICAGRKADGMAWMESILGTSNKKPTNWSDVKRLIIRLYSASFQKITTMDFSFSLLLPSDDEILPMRAQALSEWCTGFISGLNLVGIQAEHALTDELADAMFHIEEIGRLDYGSLDVSEEDELSYVEVSEYVRMAILSIYSDLAGEAPRQVTNQGNETVH